MSGEPKPHPCTGTRPWRLLIAGLFTIGLTSRVLPLLDLGGRMLRQFPTEDGYLTLQIARNMALGHGMSVSGGMIPTNGTQPFATFVWSLCFRVVGADKIAGVRLVLVAELLIACLTAYLLYRVGQRLLAFSANRKPLALLASAAHFAAPIGVMHSMNCLESGTYAMTVLVAAMVLLRPSGWPGSWKPVECLAAGLALGWCFWARNDAAFLIFGVCVAHWILGARQQGLFGRSLLEAIGIGLTTVVVASPWLHYNYTTFGHVMPISGIAESHDAVFAQNLYLMPTKVVEYVTIFAPIPERLEPRAPVYGLTALLVAASVFFGLRRHRQRLREQPVLLAVTIYAGLLFGYYGLFFGAPHFASRYLYPVSTFGALVFAWGVLAIWKRLTQHNAGALLVGGAVLGTLGLAAVENAMLYRGGRQHMHFQVVEWVDANVPEQSWVGAIQTGTLGYYHDNTYNLDGKVNPEALEAKLRDEIPQYILDKEIPYLVDWIGIAGWADLPVLQGKFEILVNDPKRNLAALRRIGTREHSGEPETDR